MAEQLGLWIDSGSPPAQMSEQVVALGREWLPQARAALGAAQKKGSNRV